jgi:hypothetical protein
MNILIAQFNYTMETAELDAVAREIAPAFSDIPGCFEKTWLIDPGAKVAGGVYKFRDRQAVDAYLASDLWKGVESNPGFTNIVTRVFGVMEGPTEVTHGLPVRAGAR